MLVLGAILACEGKVDTAEKPVPARIDAERYLVPLHDDDLAFGGEAPLVTVVMFSDYACPPCGANWRVFKNLHEDFGNDVRFVFRTFTVAGFRQGERAADAALAAAAQGKFWEMHWRLFEAFGAFDRPTLRAHAETIGLDVPRFLDDLDGGAQTGLRIRHRRRAKLLGIRGLPVMFVNGLYLVGGQTDEAMWHDLLEAEIQRSKQILATGVPRAKLYDEIMSKAGRRRVPGHDEEKGLRKELVDRKTEVEAAKRIDGAQEGQRYAVRPGPMPARGPADAPVVIVEFLDFRCPFCRRAWTEDLQSIFNKHGDDVRLAIRHYPLELHPTARGAAGATIAAANQGKFWEFHDRLIVHKGEVGRDLFERIAGELGLDVGRFRRDLDDPATLRILEQDLRLGRRLGVTGTPGFFVNGQYVKGLGVLPGAVERELESARAEMKKGVPRAKVADVRLGTAIPESEFPNP